MTHGESALGEVDLEKEMAADAGVIIHAYMTTQEAFSCLHDHTGPGFP